MKMTMTAENDDTADAMERDNTVKADATAATVDVAASTTADVMETDKTATADAAATETNNTATAKTTTTTADAATVTANPAAAAAAAVVAAAVTETDNTSTAFTDTNDLGTSNGSSGDVEPSWPSSVDDQMTYMMIPHGMQLHSSYMHPRKSSQITGVSYDDRLGQFLLLDSKGIVMWRPGDKGERILTYPNFQYRLISKLIYAKPHNVFFALGKDFELKVLNRQFQPTGTQNAAVRSVVFVVYNDIADELITVDMAGVKIWKYEVLKTLPGDGIPLSNYGLVLKRELPGVGGTWVKYVDLDFNQHLIYLCSRTDIFAYTMQGKEVFKFARAHIHGITGCIYSHSARVLATAAADTEVKIWSATGGLLHVFRGHSRAVTAIMLHPQSSTTVMTSSLDGSIRLWSLDTLEPLYSLLVSADGLLWMGLLNTKLLYVCSPHQLSVYMLNHVTDFWAQTRNNVCTMSIAQSRTKSNRVLAIGDDNSVRLFSRTSKKNLSTVLPPPSVSPMHKLKGVIYNRQNSLMFVMIDKKDIWVYTTKTDPACRVAVWDTMEIQHELCLKAGRNKNGINTPSLIGQGSLTITDSISQCLCMCYLDSPAVVCTDEGLCCPLQHGYILLGLEDGRILFMDAMVKGKRHFQFQASKDAIIQMCHDVTHVSLVTLCHVADTDVMHIWSLPTLQLQHQVSLPTNMTGFARLGVSLMTGQDNGQVVCYQLAYNNGKHKQMVMGLDEDAEHNGPVTGIDACIQHNIFCTCGRDGSLKIWDSSRHLLTEIALNVTLSTACFLNSSGDVLVGYNKHIFIIHHKKILPSYSLMSSTDEASEVESNIYEDPAVLFEGISSNDPKPITLQNYLTPFDLKLDNGLITGSELLVAASLPVEDGDTQEERSDSPLSVDVPSVVGTDLYLSPHGSYTTLCDLDFKLGYVKEPRAEFYRKSYTDFEEIDTDKENYEFPQFGVSPGTTPTPSFVSAVSPPSSDMESEPEEEEEEDENSSQSTGFAAAVSTCQPVKSMVKSLASEPRSSRLGSLRIDSQSLIKGFVVAETKEIRPATEMYTPSLTPTSVIVAKKGFKVDRRLPTRAERKSIANEELPTKVVSKVTSKRYNNVTDKPAKKDTAKLSVITQVLPPTADIRSKIVPAPPPSKSQSNLRRAVSQRIHRTRRKKTGKTSKHLSVKTATGQTSTLSVYDNQPSTSFELAPAQATPELTTMVSEPLDITDHHQTSDVSDGQVIAEESTEVAHGSEDEVKMTDARDDRSWKLRRSHRHGNRRVWDAATSAAERARAWRTLSSDHDPPPTTQELKELFQNGMKKLQHKNKSASTANLLHGNRANQFDEDWHERMIDRGLLLRLQHQLRLRSAMDMRQQRDEKRQMKTDETHETHENTDKEKEGPSVEEVAKCGLKRMQRIRDVIMGSGEGHDLVESSERRLRPHTAQARLMADSSHLDVLNKSQLSVQQPFRVRLHPSDNEDRPEMVELMDKSHYDPRDKTYVQHRPHSSVSIPAKYRRYMLSVRPQFDPNALPSPLETQLILDRFPQWRDLWLPEYLSPPPGVTLSGHPTKYMSLPGRFQNKAVLLKYLQAYEAC